MGKAGARNSITDAVILMAGVGSRLGSAGGSFAKPLVQIAGRPLISYTFDALVRAGVRDVHAVMGANREELEAALRPLVPGSIRFHPIVNFAWQKQNGVSVLAAEDKVKTPFFLLMGDHLFDPGMLELLIAQSDPEQVNLAVDRKIDSIFDLDDAMKVETRDDHLVSISKTLQDYDAIDTGLFLCSAELFEYLRGAQRDGDCSLADGVRLMAREGKVRAIDIGDSWWQDVDTPEMLQRAEQVAPRLRLTAASARA